MDDNAKLEYCRVDVKTGDILEGPVALPHKWGNVTGFNNLPTKEVIKRGWFPVALSTTSGDYGLLFLPERNKVIKVPESDTYSGCTKFAVNHIQEMGQLLALRPFYSDVLGDLYRFPNTLAEQAHRLNCLYTATTYKCVALDGNGQFVPVNVVTGSIPALLRDAVTARDKIHQQVVTGLESIYDSTDKQITALIDTNMMDFFDG